MLSSAAAHPRCLRCAVCQELWTACFPSPHRTTCGLLCGQHSLHRQSFGISRIQSCLLDARLPVRATEQRLLQRAQRISALQRCAPPLLVHYGRYRSSVAPISCLPCIDHACSSGSLHSATSTAVDDCEMRIALQAASAHMHAVAPANYSMTQLSGIRAPRAQCAAVSAAAYSAPPPPPWRFEKVRLHAHSFVGCL